MTVSRSETAGRVDAQNGNVLFSHVRVAREVTMEKKVVWEYSTPEGSGVTSLSDVLELQRSGA